MPKPNCWVGCHAYIKAPYREDARGRVVKVLRPARDTECLNGENFFRDTTDAAWVVSGEVPAYDGRIITLLAIGDGCLVPITPPPGARTFDPVEKENHEPVPT